MAILKKRGIYTNREQVEDLFKLADENGDSILSKSELKAEMKRLKNTEKAYSLMDSDK